MRGALLAVALVGCSDYQLGASRGLDRFTQGSPDAVDVLLVIDDSGSMAPWQQALADRFAELIASLDAAGTDYRIGVVTTDVAAGDGRLHGSVVMPETARADTVFRYAVGVGTHGSGYEAGLEAARRALTEPNASTYNAALLRDRAALSVVFVSDEDDGSPDAAWKYAADLGSLRDDVDAHALVVTEPDHCTEPDFEGDVGARYLEVADTLGGLGLDLCQDDFGAVVDALSRRVARLTDRFVLRDLPEVESLRVDVDGVEVPCGPTTWTLQPHDDGARAIVFAADAIPVAGAEVTARYRLSPTPPDAICPP